MSMDVNQAKKLTGFSNCNFGPSGDPCEQCDKEQVQLYFRSCDPFSNDGEYFCAGCLIKEAEENARYNPPKEH